MKNILILVAALVAAPAFADTSAVAGSLSGAAAQSGSISLANPVSNSGASAVNGAGNSQNITFTNPANTYQQVEHTGTSTVKTVPQVYAPPMGVTAPCRVALSAGVSVIGVGVAAGGSVADAPCNLRELARTYQALGKPDKGLLVADGALALECADSDVAKALGDLCPAKPSARPLPAPVAAAPVAAAPVAQPVKVATAACTSETSASGIKITSCK